MIPAPAAAVSNTDRPKDLWSFNVLGAELPIRKPTGLHWDTDGSKPDPFVRLFLDEKLVWESPVLNDNNLPEWNATLPRNLVIREKTPLRLEVWDWDSAVSADPMGAIRSTGLPTNALPDANARLTLDNLATLIVRASPPQPHFGVGIAVEIHSDGMLVLSVLPHSPASRAGIRPGEQVVAVGGVTVRALSDNDAFSRLSLAAERGETLVIATEGGAQRTVTLDKQPLWLIM